MLGADRRHALPSRTLPAAVVAAPVRRETTAAASNDEVLNLAMQAAAQLKGARLDELTAELEKIAAAYGCTLAQARERKRKPGLVALRRVMALYLSHRGLSSPEIASMLGYKCHTAVLYLLETAGPEAA
jgi:chromosomal replication initiation ATPase DnaA